MPEIKKKYNHFSIESEFLKHNYFQKLFKTRKNATKRERLLMQLPISITKDTPFESISGIIKEDIVATHRLMKGIKAKLLPVFDTQEKNLKKENYENLLTKAGIFFDIDPDNIVYSEKNTNFVRNMFVELVKEGHIYEDYSINYRDIKEQKTLGNDEIQEKKMQVKQYNLRYFVDTKNISLIVPTLRPETIFADVALAVNPDDKRYKKLLKNKVIIPIINKTIPIIADPSVDPMKNMGIMRVTPAHDKKSLMIAQKHGLQIDKFAIDKSGCFTELAGDFKGKNAKEFMRNIVKNLDDIHNLESTKHIETVVIVHRKTQEKARPLLSNQLFIKMDKELVSIQSALKEKKLKIFPSEQEEKIENMIMTMEYRPVTKVDSKGYALPLWKSEKGKSYFITDNDIINLPAKKTKNKYTALTLILFNLLVDGRLNEHFSIEECIDVLLSKSRTGESNTLATYIDIFSETLPRGYAKEINELKKLLEYTEKDIDPKKGAGINYFEKFSIGLSEYLERSVAISSKKKGRFSFDIDTLVTNDQGLVHQKEKIEETLGHALILIRIMDMFQKDKDQERICYIQEHKIFEFLKTIITSQNIQGEILFDTCYIQSEEKNQKRKKESFKEIIKKFGTDCTRLYATDPAKEITEYEQFINKLRNASRFIGQQVSETKGARKISDFMQLTKYLEKRKSAISEFEAWMMYRINELQKEYDEAMAKDILAEIQEKLIHMIKDDFCDKYLEIQKHQDTENGNKVSLRCLGTLLKLLHPFTPFITQQIRKQLGFEGPILTQEFTTEISDIAKNYKTQLLMDIIDKFIEMKHTHDFAKHEEVEICFFAPLDFLQYLRKQENIIHKLINASVIGYLENEKELNEYYTEKIINIIIGIKARDKEPMITDMKESIHKILRIKEQQIQQIRTIISGLSANDADPEIIKEKKKEMNKLKKEIDELHYQLQKEKANK